MPRDKMYLPIHAGKANKKDIGFQGDDTGDNISLQNPYFNELSAIYWAWKNLDADAVGVAHYRRHFSQANHFVQFFRGKWNCILTEEKAEKLLSKNDIITAGKRLYLVETNESHFCNAHNPKEIELMRQIISERCPDYSDAFETMLKRRWAHMFNMFIMKKDRFDDFCSWMFDLMFEFKNRIDMTDYKQSEKRAFISELLLDVYLIKNQYPYREVNVMYMEKQNWPKKIFKMLWRKWVTHENF